VSFPFSLVFFPISDHVSGIEWPSYITRYSERQEYNGARSQEYARDNCALMYEKGEHCRIGRYKCAQIHPKQQIMPQNHFFSDVQKQKLFPESFLFLSAFYAFLPLAELHIVL
jgi:hypothetical protein